MILDPYGGPRGWSEGLRMLGLSDIGIELDASACATAIAAGHRTIRADVAAFPVDHLAGRVEGLIASPPCQSFSAAGKGEGRAMLGRLAAAIHAGRWDAYTNDAWAHVLQPGRWVEAIRPRWVACEQVPPVLPLWQAYAHRWRHEGYSAWAGVLNAADYGVPQTRQRAILFASLDRPVGPPPATHARDPRPSLFGALRPWVSMAEALGWDEFAWSWTRSDGTRRGHTSAEPAPTVAGHRKPAWLPRAWWSREPATTIAGDPRITARCHHDEGSQGADAKTTEQVRAGDYAGTEPIRLTLAEALTLQSFRPDYPVQGTKTKQFEQVGNAVPPLLAAHVIAAVTGRALDLDALSLAIRNDTREADDERPEGAS